MITKRLLFVLAFSLTTPSLLSAGDTDWPRWRGPLETGHSTETALPTKWSDDSVAWKVDLKGKGFSSPIVWGERIFLTSALENGKQRLVFCLNRNDGQVEWEHIAWTGEPEQVHKMNGWATPSCATDGEHVYAFFGKGGLHCYTVDGTPVWSKDLGDFPGPWGTAGSPVIIGDLVIQNCDSDGDAYIVAVDKGTGETVWKTDRQDIRGWSTPILVKTKGRDELVINGHYGVNAYDPKTGKDLWFCKSSRGRGTATVTPGPESLLYAVGGTAKDMYAVRPGGNGDVSESHRAWIAPRKGGRDLPSPIVVGDYLLVINMAGILTCMNPTSGEILYSERVGGNHSSTPVSFNGLAFFLNEAGETIAVKPGPKVEIVAQNKLTAADDEIFRACITPSDGQLFIRSDSKLYCIGKRSSSGK